MESKDNIHEKRQVSVSSVSSLSELSTVQGMVEEKSVEVLRDTGCSGVIVSKHVVPEGAYTGRNQTMVMVDYSTRVVPEVKVNIDTPYYKGEVLALCVEKPLVDLKKVQVGKDQEKAQSEKDSHSKNQGGKKPN